MASTLQGTIEFLKEFGLFDVILPFLLIFAITYAILSKSGILGENKDNFSLGEDRAENVGKFLDTMIGKGRNKIIIESIGEKEDSKRYAKIIIKSK